MGILGATSNNNEGIAGIAPSNIQLIGQKIFPDSGGGSADEFGVALAFDSCRIKGAKLISNSWGSDCQSCSSSVINEGIRRTDSAGIVIVFSAGNAGWYTDWVGYPARLPQVLAVGATDHNDQRWYYSMHGPELDVVASSGDIWLDGREGDIWSLDRVGMNGYNPLHMTCSPQNINYDCKFGGTSAACPEVAGIIALLMLRRPDLIGQTALIRSVIDSSSEDQVGEDGYDTPGWDQFYGWGRVNADRALMAVAHGDANNDGAIDISDVVRLVAYWKHGYPTPQPHIGVGDVNCDGSVDVSDIVYLINRVFNGGPPPMICYHYTY